MAWHLFLDESGDLGFDFENTDCSKHLTISVLAVSQFATVKAIRAAVKKTLARKVNKGKKGRKRPEQELKGTTTAIAVKKHFLAQLEGQKFGVYAMTLNKQRVYQELHSTPDSKNRLYNFVARQVLSQIPLQRATTPVYLVVDRSKNKKGIAEFNDYLMRELSSQLDPRAPLSISHEESHIDLGLSAADLFCWGIFRSRACGDDEWLRCFEDRVLLNEQYL